MSSVVFILRVTACSVQVLWCLADSHCMTYLIVFKVKLSKSFKMRNERHTAHLTNKLKNVCLKCHIFG